MRLLLDEHYSRDIAARLRAAHHDAVTVADVGLTGIDDEQLLLYAASERRALLTNNVRHFTPLVHHWAAAGRDHYGLLFSSDSSMPRSSRTIGLYVEVLESLMHAHEGDEDLLNEIRWLP